VAQKILWEGKTMARKLMGVWLVVGLSALACPTVSGQSLFDDFSTNPIGTRFTITGPNTSQNAQGQSVLTFSWLNGSIVANYNSFQPTTRLQAALPVSVNETDKFRFGATFRILSNGLVINDAESFGCEFATFALINSTLTGTSRDGGDAYSQVEFSYFPQDNPYFDTTTIGPTAITGKMSQTDFFSRIFFDFGPNTTLNDEIRRGVLPPRGLPLDTPLLAYIEYDGTNLSHPTLDIKVSVVTGSGLDPLPIGVPIFDLTTAPYTDFATFFDGFSCDLFALVNYQETPWTTKPSHIGTVVFDSVFFEVEEPASRVPLGLVTTVLAAFAVLAISSIRQLCNRTVH